ncbi:MAG: hypothetical protein K6G40_07050 [Eubacterium sp.]|nr:hypothetical protein [Eubacterium sp.]
MQFRKFKRVLAIIMAAAVTLGGANVPVYAIDNTNDTYSWSTSATDSVEYTTSLTGDITFSSPVYGDAYIATSVTDFRTSVTNDWKNSTSASSNITSITLSNGTDTETISAKCGGVLTLVVTTSSGVEYQDILDLVETGDTLDASKFVIVESAEIEDYSEFAKFGDMLTQFGQYTMRAALYVKDGAISATQSVQQLLSGATVSSDGSTISGGTLTLNGPFMNGIVSNDTDSTSKDTTVTVDDMVIEADGDGANDFKGHASVLYADGDSTMNVTDTYIHTEGVIRTATAVSGTAEMKISDSVIYTEETNDTDSEYASLVVPMMKRTPFALGLEGVVRSTNVLGSGQGIYEDSLIVSSGWGVLSTDSGVAYATTGTYALDVSDVVAGIGSVEVYNSSNASKYVATKTVNGTKYGFIQGGSGYVAYADAGVYDKFDSVKFYSDDYVQIMASFASSAFYTDSTLVAGRIAVMTQQNAGGTISIKDSTVNVGDTVVQIKSGAANAGYTNAVLDNATVTFTESNKWGGTLVELVESDDAGNPGNTTYTINDTGDSAVAGQPSLTASTATLKNGTYTGNIWNNIYNNTEALDVTIDAATVNGTISSSYGYHVSDNGTRMANGTVLTACTTGDYRVSGASSGDYQKIGAQYNVANEQLNNPVNVTLTNNSTWNVVLADGTNGEADACYINNLTVESGSKIKADTTKYTASNPLTIYVYGTQSIEGTVASNINIVEADVEISVSQVKTIKAAALKKLKAKIKWSSVSNATLYQVQYSTSKKFTKKTTTTVNVKDARETKLTKLTNGKKYYVRVRAINITDGVKTKGDWSTVKTFTAKKA